MFHWFRAEQHYDILEDCNIKLIIRYNLYGSTPMEEYLVDAVIESTSDIRSDAFSWEFDALGDRKENFVSNSL